MLTMVNDLELHFEHVFVDALRPALKSEKWRWPKAAHLVCDLGWEKHLHEMASRLRLQRSWFQDTNIPHYDINQSKFLLALNNGVRVITNQELVNRIIRPHRFVRNFFRPFDMIKDDVMLIPGAVVAWSGSNGQTYFSEVVANIGIGNFKVLYIDQPPRTCEIYIERIRYICPDPKQFKSRFKELLNKWNSSPQTASQLRD